MESEPLESSNIASQIEQVEMEEYQGEEMKSLGFEEEQDIFAGNQII